MTWLFEEARKQMKESNKMTGWLMQGTLALAVVLGNVANAAPALLEGGGAAVATEVGTEVTTIIQVLKMAPAEAEQALVNMYGREAATAMWAGPKGLAKLNAAAQAKTVDLNKLQEWAEANKNKLTTTDVMNAIGEADANGGITTRRLLKTQALASFTAGLEGTQNRVNAANPAVPQARVQACARATTACMANLLNSTGRGLMLTKRTSRYLDTLLKSTSPDAATAKALVAAIINSYNPQGINEQAVIKAIREVTAQVNAKVAAKAKLNRLEQAVVELSKVLDLNSTASIKAWFASMDTERFLNNLLDKKNAEPMSATGFYVDLNGVTRLGHQGDQTAIPVGHAKLATQIFGEGSTLETCFTGRAPGNKAYSLAN